MKKPVIAVVILGCLAIALRPQFAGGLVLVVLGIMFLGRPKKTGKAIATASKREAVKAVRNRKMNVQQASIVFGIPEREIKKTLFVDELFW